MKEQIFISYSSQDMDWALIVQNALEEKGYSCWMANNGGINPGENYAEEITEALNDCPVFLLILSPNAVKSPWVPKELNIAISSRKHIISDHPLRFNSIWFSIGKHTNSIVR